MPLLVHSRIYHRAMSKASTDVITLHRICPYGFGFFPLRRVRMVQSSSAALSILSLFINLPFHRRSVREQSV
jgi:hypothetical protein